jgi:hypothetical protein
MKNESNTLYTHSHSTLDDAKDNMPLSLWWRWRLPEWCVNEPVELVERKFVFLDDNGPILSWLSFELDRRLFLRPNGFKMLQMAFFGQGDDVGLCFP